MITTLFWTVFFCLGLYIISFEGQIFYFLRSPFESNQTDLEIIEERMDHFKKFDKSLVQSLRWKLFKHQFIYHLGKPLIYCITCMASVWGVTIYWLLNGIDIQGMVINSVCASFIQTFIWNLYKRHIE